SNLMATRFAVAALRDAGTPTGHRVYKDVLLLATRCQNYPDKPQRADARFDDGGFYQNPRDPQENKAGIAGKDKWGRERFHSYGSMTADGLWLLLQCGLPPSHPRVRAARGWLERNFTPTTNPGVFQPDREFLRDSVYYYYCWAAAHVLAELEAREVQTAVGKMPWHQALAAELMRRQRSDGSWANHASDGMEDDPLVGTMWATAALTLCRRSLASDPALPPG
ncbi:MAG TPA: hypothetical protein VNA16_05010, partial [Abditibacteriaceae bacterium]|nr:hypothetical protein [Abditibacteriaceae bacterium]